MGNQHLLHDKALEARRKYLDGLQENEQARILRHAETHGPLTTDTDWLIAYSTQQAADRIENTITAFEASMTSMRKKKFSHRDDACKNPNVMTFSLWSCALALSIFAGVAYYVEHFSAHTQSLVLYSFAISLGMSGTLLASYLAKRMSK
jgi:hypothetical protein